MTATQDTGDPQVLRRSIVLLKLETVLTASVFAMPVLNGFFASIGLNQAQIGLSQAIFTIAALLLNVPTGWLADKISRRFCNALGDAIACLGFAGYAFSQNFTHVIVAEIVIGIGLALTNGVDVALLSAYCEKLGRTFRKEQAWISKWRPVAEMAAMITGGIVGAQHPRFALGLTAVPFAIGVVLSCLVKEEGERIASHVTLRSIVRECLHADTTLKWHIIAYAVTREITHPLIWVLTPLLLMAHVPPALVGIGWAFNLTMVFVGSSLAGRISHWYNWWQRFALSGGVAIAAIAILACHVSLWTVWLYGALGLVRGWVSVTGTDAIVHHSDSAHRTTIMSIASSVSQLLYIPAVLIVNAAGNATPQGALTATAICFLPLVLLTGLKLFRLETR